MPAPKLPEDITETVRRALNEDVGTGDLTASLISTDAQATAQVITREAAVLCGTAWFDEVFRQINGQIRIVWQSRDGADVHAGQSLCEMNGPARGLLTGERTGLNFLQLLSGVATRARQYTEAVHGTHAIILDTRKTVPGLRHAQKYAVVCGGGRNHRMGLYDAVLIKENHIAATGSVTAALQSARASVSTGVRIEIEVENLDQLREAIAAGADHLLLDNFSMEDLRQAVREARGRARLEASGGVSLSNIRAVAETGVDFISVGDITKNVKAVDLSMRFIPHT